ncbi:MAG: UDP-2,4-diacetamido-2,4,6-trideoxy-beta-L-altropyranose hydrolase [Bacteroidota bacterium]
MDHATHTRSQRRVVFRADGGALIGMGHLVRCFALANILRPHFHLTFASMVGDPVVPHLIRPHVDEVITLPICDGQDDAIQTFLGYLRPDDIVVIDDYDYDEAFHRAIIAAPDRRLVYIDDLQAMHMHAHAVINHNGGIQASDYRHDPHTQLYLGPDYALLRPPFLKVDPASRAKAPRDHWFVCMGGSDPFNLTEKVVHALLQLPEMRRCEVVIGPTNDSREFLYNLVASEPERFALHVGLNAEEMCKVMQSAWNAVCTSSGIAMEVCSVGMRMFTGHCVDNQLKLDAFFHERGLGLSMGDLKALTTDQLVETIRSTPVEHPMVEVQQSIFGGRQKAQLYSIFEPWK